MRRARAWLAAEGLAVEVFKGRHLTRAERAERRDVGARGIRAASVWALTGGAVSAHPSGFSREGSSGNENTPKARRAGAKRSAKTQTAPRSIRLQRLTAEVARRAPHLAPVGRHVGGLADVLVRALGPAVEGATAGDVLAIAEAGGTGRVWAAQDARDPWAWLGARLRAGRASGHRTAAERAAKAAEERAERARRREAEEAAERAASRPAVVASARASIRASIESARRTALYSTHRPVIVNP